MRELVIGTNDAGQRLDRFLAKAVPGLPGTLVQKYIRTKRIKVGGRRTERGYRLIEGDTVQLYINDEFFGTERAEDYATPTVSALEVVFEDTNILIVDKSPGLLCHAGNEQGAETLVDRVKAYLYHTGAWNPAQEQSFVPALCNRLDRNTGGLVLVGKTAAAQACLNEKIRQREVDKYYLLVVHGRPEPEAGRIGGHLVKDRTQNRVVQAVVGAEDAKNAITEYRTLETKGDLSLVECKLITGRTHQIRAQMAALGCPLVGDRKYGGRAMAGQTYQALWAYRVCFDFQGDGGVLAYLDGREFLSGDVPFVDIFR
ncbi:MAG: RluA family pseudouridine synthase [Oscillospiraceae bacterium]|nr:RluA family pseudouridine synthase [Oscillospiraceae bacterium]